MAAYTFAALFLAHVIADYVLQTRWIVINKRRVSAMAVHITLVLLAMCATTASFSPWFLALAVAHLWIDIVKTYAMPEGLGAYVADQLLHVASVAGIAALAPVVWETSPLVDVPRLPLYYMIAGGVLFAIRGGQYAVAMLVPSDGPVHRRGVLFGWLERSALCVTLIGGFPLAAAGVLVAKGLYVGASLPQRDAAGRMRLWRGTLISLGWGLGVAVPLALVMPMMQ